MQNAERRRLRLPQPAPDLAHRVSLSPATPSRITDHASRITHHPPSTRHSQKGVALVITLILLSVITFMAITFLVVSRSEKGSVSTQTDQTVARLAADAGRERAIAEVLAPILATTNPFCYGLLVSTNFINLNRFDPALGLNFTNVNYEWTKAGTRLSPNDFLQNLANLYYNPRPPVFIVTNQFAVLSNEFRFYVDLNRNGMFDPTGLLMQTNDFGQPMGFANYDVGDPQWIGVLQRPELPHSAENLFASRYAYFVVPVGQTLDINAIHNYGKLLNGGVMGVSDQFLRNQGILPSEINLAAFLADLNTNLWPTAVGSAFGFPAYSYNLNLLQPDNLAFANTGAAFDDAVGVLTYRYNYNSKSLANVGQLFGNPGRDAFTNSLDAYAAGPLMVGTWWPPSGYANPNQTRVSQNYPWSGSYNPNAFSSVQDLFDENKTAANIPVANRPTLWTLTKRLLMASTNNSSYNRNTFSRLASQLGTYSAPEPQDKMHLNYCNVDANGYVVPNMATNFIPWQPAQFFTNAAIRLLVDAGYTVGTSGSTSNLLVTNYTASGVLITNIQIPIWPTNFYTPSVHRLFQLAANIYDATTNRTDLGVKDYPFLPSVFRPLFYEGAVNKAGQRQVFIVGYDQPSSTDLSQGGRLLAALPARDLSDPDDLSRFGVKVGTNDMVYNVPLVIGAKRGMPSFDEATMDTRIQVARKLIFHRKGTSNTDPVNEIVPVYLLSITNEVGLQAWNSYATTFNRRLQIQTWPDVSVLVSNRVTGKLLNNTFPLWNRYPSAPTNYYVNGWLGYNPPFNAQSSFITPLGAPTTNYVFMPTNCVYSLQYDQFTINGVPDRTPGSTNFTVPQLQVVIKARLRFAIVDISVTPNQLLDYVNVAVNREFDLTDALMHDRDGSFACGQSYNPVYSIGRMWCTNLNTGIGASPNMSYGVRLQIDASRGSVANTEWNDSLPDPIYGTDKAKAMARFKAQFFPDPKYPMVNTFAAPFQPFRDIHVVTLLQANDPLVHYTVGDLKNTAELTNTYYLDRLPDAQNLPPTPYWGVNKRHEPWGGNPVADSGSTTKTDWRVKDSVAGVAGRSDHWDFPANKLPHVGWLGRVHRGTPWQTVYLKSPGIDIPTWFKWSGNDLVVTNFGQFPRVNMPQFTTVINGGVTNQTALDSAFSQPTNDWRLLDLFTTALDANATRGRLSINQTNLAAWSAVLSGVIVLTNTGTDPFGAPLVVQPAGAYDPDPTLSSAWPPVARIVKAINDTRTNFPSRVFHRLGDLLAVPELTAGYAQGQFSASPFLALPTPPTEPPLPLSDAVFERIPQQIFGLLKCDETPRVVIYTFGQTLKPAPRSRVTSGSFFGICTNYQITAEVATRSIVRFDGVPAYKQGTPAGITNLYPVIESFSVLPTE